MILAAFYTDVTSSKLIGNHVYSEAMRAYVKRNFKFLAGRFLNLYSTF